MSKEITEGVKEVLRTAVIAAIPLVISQLQLNQIDWRAIAIAVAIAILSGLDKFLHKSEMGINKNGIGF